MLSLIKVSKKINDEKKNEQKIEMIKSKYKIRANSISVLKEVFEKIIIN